MKILMTSLMVLFAQVSLSGTTETYDSDAPRTVSYVDLKKYAGTWYEIARYENSFQKDCLGTRATYKLKKKSVSVLNECYLKDSKNKKVRKAKGTAFVTDKESQSKLKVSFVPVLRHFGFFSGEYWILELDDNYQWALVGDSKREFLWILSRNPTMEEGQLEEIKMLAKDQGFDPSKLISSPAWK